MKTLYGNFVGVSIPGQVFYIRLAAITYIIIKDDSDSVIGVGTFQLFVDKQCAENVTDALSQFELAAWTNRKTYQETIEKSGKAMDVIVREAGEGEEWREEQD